MCEVTREEFENLQETVEDLKQTVEQQQATIEEQQTTIDDLREDLREERETRAKQDAEIRQRVTESEKRLTSVEEAGEGDDNPTPQADTTPSTTPQTPLEQTATLPEEMVEEETANVQRAVFVARDLSDYAAKVPAGRAIKSSELRRVLKAGTDSKGHSQTVERVMAILDDLGSDETRIVDRRGERRVVFSDQLCERLETLTTRGEDSHAVVTPTEA